MEGEWKRYSLSREDYGDLKGGIMKERRLIRTYKTKTGSWETASDEVGGENGYLAGGRS